MSIKLLILVDKNGSVAYDEINMGINKILILCEENMQILYIFLGWLIGLLSQSIVSRIEKHYKSRDIKIAIFSELRNLATRLAANCYRIQMHLGTNDKPTLQWIKNVYEKYLEDSPQSILGCIDKILQMPDEQFNVTRRSKAVQSRGLALKTFSLSFTEAAFEYLMFFDSKFQNKIFEVRDQISILNEEIDDARHYFRLTFNPLCMETNSDIIDTNIEKSYAQIQERCKIIADKIDKILQT